MRPSLIRRIAGLLVGPAAVMAAGTMGAGTTSSLVLAGAWFRYDLLWVALLALPLLVVTVESASRLGLLNKNVGMFSLIRERIHPAFAWTLFLFLIPLHLLVSMSHMSVMTSSLMLLAGFSPPEPTASAQFVHDYRVGELVLTAASTLGVLWLLLSSGYQRMQKIMTICVVLMVSCFMIVAVRALGEIGAILGGVVPSIPPDLPTSQPGVERLAVTSIIAIVGSVLAPPAMLGISYMSSDDSAGAPDLRANLRSSIVNLGLLVGAYSVFLMIGGANALFPLSNHAEIDTVYEASVVLTEAFPRNFAFVGFSIYTIGLMIAAVTTFVVVAEIMTYFTLDMLRLPWRQTADNRAFKISVAAWVLVPGMLAPFWDLPELLKLVLLMGFNTVIVPLVILIVIYFVNDRRLMGAHKAGVARNLLLAMAAAAAITLAFVQAPQLWAGLWS